MIVRRVQDQHNSSISSVKEVLVHEKDVWKEVWPSSRLKGRGPAEDRERLRQRGYWNKRTINGSNNKAFVLWGRLMVRVEASE